MQLDQSGTNIVTLGSRGQTSMVQLCLCVTQSWESVGKQTAQRAHVQNFDAQLACWANAEVLSSSTVSIQIK